MSHRTTISLVLLFTALAPAMTAAQGSIEDRDRFFDRPARPARELSALTPPEKEPNLHIYLGGFYADADSGLFVRGVPYEVSYEPSAKWQFGLAGDAYDDVRDSANGNSSGFGDVILKATRVFGASDDTIRPTLQAKVILPVGSEEVTNHKTDYVINGRLRINTPYVVWKIDASARRYGNASGERAQFGYKGIVGWEKSVGAWFFRGEYADARRRGTSHEGSLGLITSWSRPRSAIYLVLQKGVTSAADRGYVELGYEWGITVK